MKQSGDRRSRVFGHHLLALLLLAGGAVALETKAPPVVSSEELGGKDRYAAYVSTDKPIYRTGEKVYVRSVLLDAASRKPAPRQAPGQFEVKGPKGNTVAGGFAQTQDSVSGFVWDIPADLPGGEYRLSVSYPELGTAPAVRKFDIRAYRAPRIKTQIKFLRDGYGPGDTVAATLEANRAEGGKPENAKVTITARLDGAEVHQSSAVLDAAGNCRALFKLPRKIERGDGTLVFTIEDGGVVETASKTIPILLQTVDLTICPEGGDLVAGLPCRVYLEARTPFGKPADIAGAVVDGAGKEVGTFRTEHEGRGRFVFAPKKDQAYKLKITEPAGIAKTFDLPAVQPLGTTLTSGNDVYPRGEPVVLRVNSTQKGPFTVTLRQREVEVASLTVKGAKEDGEKARAEVSLTPPASADGVLIATVWDAAGKPLAERLIFREPARKVRVSVAADRERYMPGGTVSLTVKAIDDAGDPAEAVVGLTVTDDSVLEMIEKREQAPRLPVMVLLEPEVRELADAQVYLDPENRDAPKAVDLLLGTQGWRRFALVRVTDFLKEYGDEGRRALALSIVTRREREMIRKSAARRGRRDDIDADGLPMAMPQGAEVEVAAAPAEMPVPVMAPPAAPPMPAANEEEKAQAEMPGQGKDDKAPEPAASQPAGRREQMGQALDAAGVRADRLEIAAGKREAFREMAEPVAFVTVREYMHKVRANRQPNDRADFAETLFWNAGVKTDAKTGTAKVTFDLNDAVTSFRVFADAFAASGALGSGAAAVESVQPFYVEPKLPLEVTMGDRILLPVGVVNRTDTALADVKLDVTAAKGIGVAAVPAVKVPADTSVRRIVELSVGELAGETDFVLAAMAQPYSDKVTRKLRVVPRGFPVEVGEGGMLSPDKALSFTITIPATRVPGSVISTIAVYPTPLANLTEALERLIQEPYGCFEQTSSSTYPLVMAQQYFLSHQGVDPKLIERSRELLKKGYERLTGFECKGKGYEWFGEDPGHEALSAYGLLEFTDMAKVHGVDPQMLERTRQWLLGTKDGKGGYKRERRALHTWIADADCSNAYITWALLVAGEPAASLAAEIEQVKKAAQESKNAYVVALGANVAWLAGDKETAKKLTDRLAAAQNKDGYVDGATTTIVGSGGEALQIEATSLAILAWLNDPAHAGAVEKGIQWIAEVCKAGRYGSTQSTVLALRAILAYDAARAKPKAPGSVQLTVDGRKAGSAAAFDDKTTGAIKLTDIAELLEPGAHKIEIAMTGGSEMPCSVAVRYSNEKPDSSDKCKVGIETKLSAGTVAEGGVVEANVTVFNKAEDEIIPTPIAIVGIPAGLEVRHDQLKELVKAKRIAAYEVLGREVVLYWRDLQAGKKVEIPLSLVAAVPGTYTAPASRAYLYYTDEFKTWAEPLKVTIEPKQ